MVSRSVSSALESLTSVFGMGTGGSSPLSSPDFFFSVLLESTIILLGLPKLTENYIERLMFGFLFFSYFIVSYEVFLP